MHRLARRSVTRWSLACRSRTCRSLARCFLAASLILLLHAPIGLGSQPAAAQVPAPTPMPPPFDGLSPLEPPTLTPGPVVPLAATETPALTPTPEPTSTPTATPTATVAPYQVSPLQPQDSGSLPEDGSPLWIGGAAVIVLAGSAVLLLAERRGQGK